MAHTNNKKNYSGVVVGAVTVALLGATAAMYRTLFGSPHDTETDEILPITDPQVQYIHSVAPDLYQLLSDMAHKIYDIVPDHNREEYKNKMRSAISYFDHALKTKADVEARIRKPSPDEIIEAKTMMRYAADSLHTSIPPLFNGTASSMETASTYCTSVGIVVGEQIQDLDMMYRCF